MLRGCTGRIRRRSGRHFLIVVSARDALEQRRGICFAREDRRAVVTAFEGVDFSIETEFAPLLLFAVALDAVLLQKRTDVAVEVAAEECNGNAKQSDEVFHQ